MLLSKKTTFLDRIQIVKGWHKADGTTADLKLGIPCLMGANMSRRFVPLDFHCLFLALFFALVTSLNTAQAHLVTSGAGPFFDGVAHFFVSLDDLLVVVALSLLSGLLGKTAARGLVLVLPLTWFVGMVLGLYLSDQIDGSAWATAFTLLVGGFC